MKLLDRLRSAFGEEEVAAVALEQSLSLATAVLLFEVVWADHQVDETELEALRAGLSQSLGLSEDEIDELVEETRARHDEHVGVFEFTRLVNEQCSHEQKFELVTNLWRIAFADGHASAVEEHTIRKISDLLYLEHRNFIRAKQRARDDQR